MARLPTPPVSCFVLGFVFLYTFVSLLNSLTSGKTTVVRHLMTNHVCCGGHTLSAGNNERRAVLARAPV